MGVKEIVDVFDVMKQLTQCLIEMCTIGGVLEKASREREGAGYQTSTFASEYVQVQSGTLQVLYQRAVLKPPLFLLVHCF